MEKIYITPTIDDPIFKGYSDYFGYIEQSMYKNYEIHTELCWSVGATFATNLSDAITNLHDYIRENKDEIHPKSKFTILMVDGTANKHGDVNEIKCYSISMKQAKQFKLI